MPIKDIYKKLIDPNYTPTNEELDKLSNLAGGFAGGGLVLKGPNAVKNALKIAQKMVSSLNKPDTRSLLKGRLTEAYLKAKYPLLLPESRRFNFREVDPFEAMDSETMRIVYGNSIGEGKTMERAFSASAPCPTSRRLVNPDLPTSPAE